MTTPSTPPTSPPSTGPNWGKIALIGCAAILVLALLVVAAAVGFLILRRDSHQPAVAPVTTSQPVFPVPAPVVEPPGVEQYPGATVLEPGTFHHEALSSIDASDPLRPDGSNYEAYQLYLEAGQSVTVTMTSGDFDAYLTAVSPSGTTTNDDDSGGGTNARLSLVVNEPGTWTFLANTLGAGESGGYSFVLEASTGP